MKLKYTTSSILLAIILPFCLISCIEAAKITKNETKIDEDDCPKTQIESCNAKKLMCCAKLGNICCTENEYFDQFPSLNEAKAEPRGIVRGLMKIIGIMVGVAIFVVVVCCVCCFCCPF